MTGELLLTLMYKLNFTVFGGTCITYTGGPGDCIPLRSCPIFEQGVLSLNDTIISRARSSVCNTTATDTYVCCPTETPTYEHFNLPSISLQNNFTTLDQEKPVFVQSRVDILFPPLNGSEGVSPVYVISNESIPVTTEPQNKLGSQETTTITAITTTNNSLTALIDEIFTTPSRFSESSISPNLIEESYIRSHEDPEPVPIPHMTQNSSSDSFVVSVFTIPQSEECGYIHLDDQLKNNDSSDVNNFPWLALLNYRGEPQLPDPFCIGTLVSRRYVLTSANCILLPELKGYHVENVLLGQFDNDNIPEDFKNGSESCEGRTVKIRVETSTYHPNHTAIENVAFDVGLLRLAQCVNVTQFVRPICLPVSEEDSPDLETQFFSSGWSLETTDNGMMKRTRAKGGVVPISSCSATASSYNYTLNDYHLCYNNEGNQNCTELGGGSLMFSRHNQWFIHGISSFLRDFSCNQNQKVVYSRLPLHREWLMENIRDDC